MFGLYCFIIQKKITSSLKTKQKNNFDVANFSEKDSKFEMISIAHEKKITEN